MGRTSGHRILGTTVGAVVVRRAAHRVVRADLRHRVPFEHHTHTCITQCTHIRNGPGRRAEDSGAATGRQPHNVAWLNEVRVDGVERTGRRCGGGDAHAHASLPTSGGVVGISIFLTIIAIARLKVEVIWIVRGVGDQARCHVGHVWNASGGGGGDRTVRTGQAHPPGRAWKNWGTPPTPGCYAGVPVLRSALFANLAVVAGRRFAGKLSPPRL